MTIAISGCPTLTGALIVTVVTKSAGASNTVVMTGPPMSSVGSESIAVGGAKTRDEFWKVPEFGALPETRIVTWLPESGAPP